VRKLKPLLLTACISLFLVACTEEESEPNTLPHFNEIETNLIITRNTPLTLSTEHVIDLDGDELTFSWGLLDGPELDYDPLSSDSGNTLELNTGYPGTYEIELSVEDGQGSVSQVFTVTITNTAPLLTLPSEIEFDLRTDSTIETLFAEDAENDDLTFSWFFNGITIDSNPEIENKNSQIPSLIFDKTGYYNLIVYVSDGATTSTVDMDISVIDSICVNKSNIPDFELLLTEDATNLSEYKLFQNQCDPTGDIISGTEYLLTTNVFKDHTSVYRRPFMPQGEIINYSADGIYDFPLGTTFIQTYAMPKDTSQRSLEHETLLETRMSIKRESGWVYRNYIWNEDQTDAVLSTAGKTFDINLKHNGEDILFQYKAPAQHYCTKCHIDNGSPMPIAMRTIYLNALFDVPILQQSFNQLEEWSNGGQGILANAPVDIQSLPSGATITPEMNAASVDDDDLEHFAKTWLDISCAHCHNPSGDAALTNTKLAYSNTVNEMGLCTMPIAFDEEGNVIINPGDAETSVLYNRIVTENISDRMPPLNHTVIDQTGAELVKRWINQMDSSLCQ
jgi:uncharacterized repeat protein (TIGR03806 family)